MKILELIFSLSSGGAERFVVDLSNELANQGHELHLVVYRNSLKSGVDANFNNIHILKNVKFYNLNIKEGIRISAFTETRKIIYQIKPDIVHCHLNVIPYIFPIAFFDQKIKFFHTLHNIANKTVGNNFQKTINWFFYRSNKIRPIVISETCNDSYRKFYNLQNAITIENGRAEVKETQNYNIVKHEIDSIKDNLNVPTFIHVARFSEQKNQSLLVDVFNRIESEGVDFILMILGSSFDTFEGKQLQEKACKSIIFLGAKQNINDYFLCADAFCLSSIYEGLPISLLEALSAGCIPICTPVGGIPDVIKDSITGFLSDDLSEESYYLAIKRYLKNPIAIKKNILQDHFNKNYSIKKCAVNHIKLFIS